MLYLTFLAKLSGETLSSLPLGAEFGFNGNILETNIINLAVVIGVVVYFGGKALGSLLENRRQTILNNLEEADERAREAQQRLNQSKYQLEVAQKKAVEIKKQGSATAESETKQSGFQTQNDVKRLEENKQETLKLQNQKAVNKVYQQFVFRALNRVRKRLSPILDVPFHRAVNNVNIRRFINYKP